MDLATRRKISFWFGVVYLVIGVLGFIPGITIPSDRTGGMAGEGLLLGIFAVNTLHNIAHLIIGAALVWTGTSAPDPMLANRILAGLFLVLFIGSFIAPVVEGVALNAPDSVLHLASALLTGYLGFAATRSLPSRV